MENGDYLLGIVVLSLMYFWGENRGRADTSKPAISYFQFVWRLVLFILLPVRLLGRACVWYRDARQRSRLNALVLEPAVPVLDITPNAVRTFVKDICPGVQVHFAIGRFDVVPTLHVTSAALIEKIGGEQLALRGQSTIDGELDLVLFNRFVLAVTEQVFGLLASFDYQIDSDPVPEQAVESAVPERFTGEPERVVVKDLCSGVQVKLLKFANHIVPELCTSNTDLAEKLGGESVRLAPVDFPVFDLTVLSGICLDAVKQATDMLATLGFHVSCNSAVSAQPVADVGAMAVRAPDEVPIRVLWKDVCNGVRLKTNVFQRVVEPEVHVTTKKLKEKLGGDVMPLQAVAINEFDLDALTGILLNVSSQVLTLVSSLEETKPVLPQVASAVPAATKAGAADSTLASQSASVVAHMAAAVAPSDKLSSKDANAVSDVAFEGDKFVVGHLQGYGLSNRTFNDEKEGKPKVRESYYADVLTAAGQIVRKWGVDLERGIESANLRIGDPISIEFTGKVGRKNIYIVRRV